MSKTARIYTRCDQRLLERVRLAAERLGLSVSAYIVMRLTEAARRDTTRSRVSKRDSK